MRDDTDDYADPEVDDEVDAMWRPHTAVEHVRLWFDDHKHVEILSMRRATVDLGFCETCSSIYDSLDCRLVVDGLEETCNLLVDDPTLITDWEDLV